MKAIFTIILLVLITVSIFTPNTLATSTVPSVAPTEVQFDFEEEEYVDDIPFDTKDIADSAK